jgi:phage tail sheath protein FI
MAQIKTGASAPKSVSSVQAKGFARFALAEILDDKNLLNKVATAIAGQVGENDPVNCACYAVEQALAGIGFLPEQWAPVITARDRSAKE